MNTTTTNTVPYDPTTKEAAEDLCRRLGLDPAKWWGVVNDFACDAFAAGQQYEHNRVK